MKKGRCRKDKKPDISLTICYKKGYIPAKYLFLEKFASRDIGSKGGDLSRGHEEK